jgi:hypothetical protein
VGACGGDAAVWRERWHRVSRPPAAVAQPETAEPISASGDFEPPLPVGGGAYEARGSEIGGSEISDGPEEFLRRPGAEARRRFTSRRRAGRHSRFAKGAVLVLTAGLPVWFAAAENPGAASARSGSSAAGGCPSFATGLDSAFTGVTYEAATHVRAGASLSAEVRGQIPAGCTLEFRGYCLGDVVQSVYSDSPDMRWFEMSGGGLVASAVIHGDPPPGMRPGACPQDEPAPMAISLTLAPGGTGTAGIRLEAGGTRVSIVGFAAFYAGSAGESAQWHQLAMTAVSTPYFTAALPTGQAGETAGSGPVPVVADACLGGEAPTPVVAVDAVRLSTPASIQPLTLNAAGLAQAERSACGYPTTG